MYIGHKITSIKRSTRGYKVGLGVFSNHLTPELQRQIDEINKYYGQFSPYVQYAVTLQTTLIPRRGVYEAEKQRMMLEEEFNHFRKRLNYYFFKKGNYRNPQINSLLILPVIEGSGFSPEGKRTLHYHVGLGNMPETVNDIELEKVIREIWQKVKYTQDIVNLQPADPGWLGYITKEVEQGNIDCIDWRNACIPHEALHI